MAPICAAPSRTPSGTTSAPCAMSPPRGLTFAPGSTAPGTTSVLPSSRTTSIGTTASAPSGTAPPVAIAIASPVASAVGAGRPAAIRNTIGNVPGASAARTA